MLRVHSNCLPTRHQSQLDGKVLNSHILIDGTGTVRSLYNKLHLFDAVGLTESETTARGGKVVAPVETPIGKVGMQIVSFTVRRLLYLVVHFMGSSVIDAFIHELQPASVLIVVKLTIEND